MPIVQAIITTETTKTKLELLEDIVNTEGSFDVIWEKICRMKAALQKEQP